MCDYKTNLPHDVGVKGSYYTGNIGDRAIGEIIKQELANRGYRSQLLSRGSFDKQSTHNILGGGGVIHDWQDLEKLHARLDFLSSGDMILGVGAPGLQSDTARQLVQDCLSDLSLITVRDERSKRVLNDVTDAEIHTTACPAWLYTDPNEKTKQLTGVNFRPWFDMSNDLLSGYFGYKKGIDTNRSKEAYLDNIHQIVDGVDNPVFIPFKQQDEEFAKKHLDIDIFEYEFSVSKTLKKVSQVDQMVCTRYHSLIFASLCSKPVLPIAYAPKVSSLTDRLELPAYKPHKDIPVEFTTPDHVNEMRLQARRNFDLMDDVVNTDR
ncbi:hypothetical protein DJ73_19390 [Halorubrum sp. Ea1]|nr:polysaccharide pyruvyl transferase family protein [Halorubrum sp. Ea1]OYR48486.1 hypothetical protein DJ73_19390 [Halorubrum sp. Ea1]